jgi:flagellar biosynthesis GTPase FlhF
MSTSFKIDNCENENNSIISDITDNNTSLLNNFEIDNSFIFKNNIHKMNIDELKEKCKINKISGISKFKKQELIQVLMNEFNDIWIILKNKNLQQLREIYKTNKIKEKIFNGNTKNSILNNIMSYNSKCENMMFIKSIKYEESLTIQEEENIKNDKIIEEQEEKENIKKRIKKQEQEEKIKSDKIIEEQEEKEKIKNDKLIEEQEEKEKIKNDKIIEEQEEKEKIKSDKIIEEQEEKIKNQKKKIPKNVKTNIWNTYIDANIPRHKCLCCKKSIILNTEFHVGHVISEFHGGTLEINNLRPICASCNYSMGTMNMVEYIIKYGYYL